MSVNNSHIKFTAEKKLTETKTKTHINTKILLVARSRKILTKSKFNKQK